jgi:hypothetical protein
MLAICFIVIEHFAAMSPGMAARVIDNAFACLTHVPSPRE